MKDPCGNLITSVGISGEPLKMTKSRINNEKRLPRTKPYWFRTVADEKMERVLAEGNQVKSR